MDAALKKRLESLLSQPGNQKCADCKKKGPRWASANLGIFVCIECSGIHRNLGVHISFVRSVNLDTWTKPQVENMELWGNDRANAYYEANVPSNVYRPKEGDPVKTVEKYIRDKYEYKRYIAKELPPVNSTTATSSNDDTDKPKRTSTNGTNVKIAPAKQQGVKPVAPAAEVSLIDFMDEPVNPIVTQPIVVPAPVAVPAVSQQFNHFSDGFGEFSSAPTTAAPTVPHTSTTQFDFPTTTASPPQATHNDSATSPGQQQQQSHQATVWTSFDTPQQAAPAVPAPTKPTISADAILSLYNAPPVPTYPPAGMYPHMPGAIPGMYPQHPAGVPPGMYPHPSAGPTANYGANLSAMPTAPGLMYQPGYGVPAAYPNQVPHGAVPQMPYNGQVPGIPGQQVQQHPYTNGPYGNQIPPQQQQQQQHVYGGGGMGSPPPVPVPQQLPHMMQQGYNGGYPQQQHGYNH